MDQVDLLLHAAVALDRLAIPYSVIGSVASIIYGEPRFTNDIHIVVVVQAKQAQALCREFPEEQFYVSIHAAVDAAIRHGQFNVIHPDSGLKIDFIVAEPTAFNQSRLSRARRVQIAPGAIMDPMFSSPEDIIIKKLEYYWSGGSDKHLRDIAGILKTCGSQLDFAYIEHWTVDLGLQAEWESARASQG